MNLLSIYDEEERWITIGLAESGELPLVVHSFEELSPQESLIRIDLLNEAGFSPN
jgi:hypothetical protein